MKKILIPLASLFMANYQAQSGNIPALPNIIPPSATAYALGNYGNVPVGLFTGSPNISVPLLTYKTNNLTLPFSLFYTSNGLKVDEVSSNVGLGWNLNFGGVITRMVRDRADETSTHINVPESFNGGYNDPVTNKFLYAVGNASSSVDTEADLYSFNFNGNSGKFFFDQSNVPHIVDQQAIKIEKNTEGFILTTANGEKYYFTETEQTIYRSVGNGHSVPSSAITAWYLTKITHPNGDEIYLTYGPSSLSEYIGSQSQYLKMSLGYPYPQSSCQGGSGYISAPSISGLSDNTVEVLGKKILSIGSNNPNDGSITFEYEADTTSNLDVDGNKKIKVIRQFDRNGNLLESNTFNYLNTSNKRNFLTGIVYKDPNKSYSFEYNSPTDFPTRLSYGQDKWGYNNGKPNNNLIPKGVADYNLKKYNYGGADKEPDPDFSKIGMLKRITYPTKGYTDIEYEGNTYWGEKTIYPDLVYKQIQTKTDNFTDESTNEFTFTSATDQTIVINATLTGNSIAACNSFVSSGHYAGSVTINQGTPYNLTRDGNSLQITLNLSAGNTYTVSVHANFMCSNVRANFWYYPTAPVTFNTNLDTGGVRVKSTKDVDTGSQNVYKRYYYAHKDDINHSSGLKGNNPYYVDIERWQTACQPPDGLVACLFVDNSNVVLSSSSLMPLYDTGVMSCLYPFVTISEGGDNFEKGGEMKEFKVRRDDAGSNIWGPGSLSNNPWTNKGWDNGVELKSTVLRKNVSTSNLDIIKETENVYEKNTPQTFELKNFAGRMLYNTICPSNYPYTCTSTDVSVPNTACTGKAPGTQVYLSNIDNLNISEYRLISYWHYLKSQKTTEYLNGSPLLTQTEYFYNNPSHYQLNKQKITLPDGIINETNYQYAHEKGNQLMITKNMVGIPLETSTTQIVNGLNSILSKTETIYPTSIPTSQTGSLVLPTSALSYNLQNGNSSTEVTYDKYDDKGNLLQYTTKDGIPVTIIWGYNKTLPIAKVIGIDYTTISDSFGDVDIVNASNIDAVAGINNDETALLNTLATFRNSYPRHQITTFTYDPLVGVRSITPPSGIREVYIYDSANRLKEVREQNQTGKLLKEYQYNYKH